MASQFVSLSGEEGRKGRFALGDRGPTSYLDDISAPTKRDMHRAVAYKRKGHDMP